MSSDTQICFYFNGFMFCNFVVRKGIEIRSKTGKYLKFPVKWKRSERKEDGVTETATTSEKQ